MHSFHKDMCHGPHNWTIEFFMGFSELMEEDRLKVINESRATCNIVKILLKQLSVYSIL